MATKSAIEKVNVGVKFYGLPNEQKIDVVIETAEGQTAVLGGAVTAS